MKSKYAGTHTTLVELARPICDEIASTSGISGVAPGHITTGTRNSNSQRVKIAEGDGCILLTFRSARAVQEVRIYTDDHQGSKLAIARLIRNRKVAICFSDADKKRQNTRRQRRVAERGSLS